MTPLDANAHRPLEGGPSFTLGNRVLRAVWAAAWLMLARFTPPPLHGWRRLVLRAFGAKVGQGARVHGSAKIWLPSNLTLGENVLVGPGVQLYNQGSIAIGPGTVISQRAFLCASSHDVSDPHFQLVLRPIAIGARCWIAAEAFIGPGCCLGDEAVIAARAALFQDAEGGVIYSGNPAQPLRRRNLHLA